jgi:hypothetical protein
MICATCLAATDTPMCGHCGFSTRLAQKYTLLSRLGATTEPLGFVALGPAGESLVAERIAHAAHVLNATWEGTIRNLAAMRGLGHPLFPAVCDIVLAGDGDLRAVWLVREHFGGAARLDKALGRRWSQAEVLEILTDLLDGLASLHVSAGLAHGRVQPGCILRRKDGRLALANLQLTPPLSPSGLATPGAAAPAAAPPSPFAAPEAGEGPPTPRWDVYSAGLVAVRLLGGLDGPAHHDARGRLDWTPPEGVHPDFAGVLLALTHRSAAARPADGVGALELLGKVHGRAAARAGVARPPVAIPDAEAPVATPTPKEGGGGSDDGETPSSVLNLGFGALAAGVVALLAVIGLAGGAFGGPAEARVAEAGDVAATSEDAVGERARLAERVVRSYGVRECVAHWRDAHPGAPDDEPHLTVAVTGAGTLVPVPSSEEEGDILRDLDSCVNLALGRVRGPEAPIRQDGLRLSRLVTPLGRGDTEHVTFVYDAS